MYRLSFRYLLGLALILVNLGLTALVAAFSYRVGHDAIVNQARESVGMVAQGRARAMGYLLTRRQQRLEGFLVSVERLCGEQKAGASRMGFEEQCVRAAVGGLHESERATATDVRYRERSLARAGVPRPIDGPVPGQLAKIDAVAGSGSYAMHTSRGDLSVDVQFDLDDINNIFLDRAGLDAHGEIFLTDPLGYRLTSAPFAIPAQYPVRMTQVSSCLQGSTEAMVGPDSRGVDVISGMRLSPDTGGGCIVANVQYEEAAMPIARLRWTLIYASALIGLLGGVVSMVVAGFVTRPIKRLAEAAKALGDGDLDANVPVSGPSEVRQLGMTLSRMTSSIRVLVRKEQKARLDAEAASRTKDDFLATLSHELRTPLNAILGWASILSRTDRDRSRVIHAVRVIERNARVQSQLIEELLDVSRIASGRVRLNLSSVPVATAIDAAIESIRPAADAKGVMIRKRVDLDTRSVRADPRRLQQIIWNLLSNAVRFTPSGGLVQVSARGVNEGVEITVTDTGAGIAPDFLPRIFERFLQADSSTTRSHGGLGLGLAIVRDLLQLHGGTVRAESRGAGLGSTFTAWLPERGSDESEAAAANHDDQLPQLVGARVLVVDDDADARDVLRNILEDAGAEVTTSASARETRAILSDAHPDLLIADIGMPGEDGYSLIQSIRQLDTDVSHVPAIALTAHSRPEDAAQALRAGFQVHMAKPIDSASLVASIASLFDATS